MIMVLFFGGGLFLFLEREREMKDNSIDIKFKGNFAQASQDIEPYLAYAKSMREIYDDPRKDKSFRRLAVIPDIVAVDVMMKYGINIHQHDLDQDARQRFGKIIKEDYPHLLLRNISIGVKK